MMTDTAGTRTRDRSDDEPWVVAGVDTHKDTHHVAAGSAATGTGLGDMRVPATPAGYDQPRDFVRSHGRIRMIGIEGTGSYGAGPARALRAAGAPTPGVIRPKRSQRRRGKSDPIDAYAAAGRALAEADALPVAKTGTGPCEQIRVLLAWRRSAMKARARRPPADHRPAGHRPRRRAHPLRPPQRRGGSPAPWPARAPPRPPTAPASATARALRRLARRHRILTDEIADIDTELRALTARAAPTMLATKALRRQPPPPCSPAPATTPAESAPRPPSPPCAAPPRSPPAPGRPTATDSTAAATDRPTGSRTPTPRPPGDPRTKARAARLTATGKNCKEILRRPRTRHRPRSTAPAGPPPTRTPHRRPAPRAPRTRTHPPPKPPTT